MPSPWAGFAAHDCWTSKSSLKNLENLRSLLTLRLCVPRSLSWAWNPYQTRPMVRDYTAAEFRHQLCVQGLFMRTRSPLQCGHVGDFAKHNLVWFHGQSNTLSMTAIEKHAPGDFCWIELATTDQAAAKQFYSTLFG